MARMITEISQIKPAKITPRKMFQLIGMVYVTKIGMNSVIAMCQPMVGSKIHVELHVTIVLVKFMSVQLKLRITCKVLSSSIRIFYIHIY